MNTAFNGEFATNDKRAVLNLARSIEFPMTLKDIPKFERLNMISINVYGIKNKEILPLRLTGDKKDKHVNLLYLQDPRDDSSYQFHRNKDCIAWFARQLVDLAHRVKNIVSANVPIEKLSKHQWEAYRSATRCHICEKPFASDDTRVRDHCHFTGRYRGPAHANCNLNYKDSFYIPVVFHNLSGYDAHFIIKEIATAYEGHVDVLPITKEKYISFTKHVDWDAMLKHTHVKFELLIDIDMQSCDSSKPSSYLMYYDVNLYGWAMYQPLPYADFQWVEDAANFDVSAIVSDSPTGYILEVDLKYPQHLHDRHTDLPFCPTRDKPPGKREDKLLATLYDKQRYVIHCLIYHIECEDHYETIKRDIVRFDTSDYPVNNAYGIPLANKKVPGLMKDENNGTIMTEFVGLRAKMYALRVDGKDSKKAKGVKSNVVVRTITFDDYTRCLNEEIEMTRLQSCIRSKLHEVYTISESKIALSPYDDKRYVVPDSTETLSWGHWRIPL
ncbi:hypothetical protein ALC60_11679 [Trachymyrmex zeteki]|uniref:DNA-directed DNA polymerase n=1 Tax=Mycetomoellerius zeteki TaxID=64791 RepID=A0A151WN17_9HYME|nr:hypothetical protein ALC60_11679 [Trachymyrmex zeteki]